MPRIFAISDLHLSFQDTSFQTLYKPMTVFGEVWKNHPCKIEKKWRETIKEEDLILIAGDFSWALKIEQALPDLVWLHRLPGTKVLIEGNHDYWKPSLSKLKTILPSSIYFIRNNSFFWQNVAIGGSRLWDIPGVNFHDIIDWQNQTKTLDEQQQDEQESQKILLRELHRLEESLKTLSPKAHMRIAMTHFPPIGINGEENAVTKILEKYHIDICVFGHLHHLKKERNYFGIHRGISYHLTAYDYLENGTPLLIATC